MANEKRLRANSIGGLIEDNPLTNVATTLTSAALAAVPAVDSTSHIAIVLDPDGIEGSPEIAWITAHTAAATTATILRAQEATTAIQHSQGIPWVHAPTVNDFIAVAPRTLVLSDPGTSTANITIDAGTPVYDAGYGGLAVPGGARFHYAQAAAQAPGNWFDLEFDAANGASDGIMEAIINWTTGWNGYMGRIDYRSSAGHSILKTTAGAWGNLTQPTRGLPWKLAQTWLPYIFSRRGSVYFFGLRFMGPAGPMATAETWAVDTAFTTGPPGFQAEVNTTYVRNIKLWTYAVDPNLVGG